MSDKSQSTDCKKTLKRSFSLAVRIPPHIAQQIQDHLKKAQAEHSNWEWKVPDDYHVTIATPGHLTDARTAIFQAILNNILKRSFDLKLKGISYFLIPKRRYDRSKHVLWARLESMSDNHIQSLHYEILKRLKAHGFHYGREQITAHVTIAKVPGNDINLMKDFVAANDNLETTPFLCDHFDVIERLPPDHNDHPQNNDWEGTRFPTVRKYPLDKPSGW